MTNSECKRCGNCCINPTLEIRPPQYGDFLEEDGWQVLGNVQGNRTVGKQGPCSHLQNHPLGLTNCDIFPKRPTKCRTHSCKQ